MPIIDRKKNPFSWKIIDTTFEEYKEGSGRPIFFPPTLNWNRGKLDQNPITQRKLEIWKTKVKRIAKEIYNTLQFPSTEEKMK